MDWGIASTVTILHPVHDARQLLGAPETEEDMSLSSSTLAELGRHLTNVVVHEVTEVIKIVETRFHDSPALRNRFKSNRLKDEVISNELSHDVSISQFAQC